MRVGTGEPVAEARVTLTKLPPAAAAVLASGGTGPIDFAPPPPPPPPIAGAGGAVGGTVFSFTSEGAVSPSLAANIPQATADEHGTFTFKDLDAGAYRLSVAGNG